jgi:ABC-type glycerol-3-phosphate transport system substrate-binding protein
MTSPNGNIEVILGSSVETGMFYSKAAFAKAGITAAPASWADFVTDLGKLKAAGITPMMFADGSLCNPSWFERLATSSLLSGQVSQFDVNHAQVTTGLDVAVGIHKGIISMHNPRYAEVWKLLGQLVSYSAKGQSGYDACSNPNATTPPLSTQALLIQGKVGIDWGGSWFIPQMNSAGFTNKFGVFPEPPITTASTSLATGTSTVGVIGGPNGNGQWGVTSQQADHTMTPAKTKMVMNFLAWLFTPQHLGNWIKISQSGGEIPTEPTAPTVNLPGLKSLVPTGTVPTVVDVVLDDVLSTVATNSGLRLVQDYVDGSMSYPAFASQWQSLLTSSANSWATTNHVNLDKY